MLLLRWPARQHLLLLLMLWLLLGLLSVLWMLLLCAGPWGCWLWPWWGLREPTRDCRCSRVLRKSLGRVCWRARVLWGLLWHTSARFGCCEKLLLTHHKHLLKL